MRASPHEAGPVDHVGFPLNQGLEQRRVFAGIVFQVGILDDDEVARGFLDPPAQRRAFPHVSRLQQHSQGGRILAFEFRENVARRVGRSVIHTEQLNFEGNVERKDVPDDAPQRRALVIDRHDYREFQ